jgi:hypothetical protein
MKRLSFVAVAGLLLSALGIAQTKPPSMEVGTVTLSLGIPRDQVLSQITQAGYKTIEVRRGKDTVLAVTQRNLADPVQRAMVLVDNDGELLFGGGLLVRIIKQITPSDMTSDRDLAFLLYALTQELEKERSNQTCSVRTTEDILTTQAPEIQAKQVSLTCVVGAGIYRSSHIRLVTGEKLKQQFGVTVWQELSRDF